MAIVTTESLRGNLKQTVRACDYCHQPAAILAGRVDLMVCDACDEILDAAEAKRQADRAALEAHALKLMAQQDQEREAARAA